MSQNAIETYGLVRRFGKAHAVDGLNLEVPRGAVYGFLGLNGAGKSTTIRMLLGLMLPTAGNISVLGLDPRIDPLPVKRRVGYVPDVPLFYEWMTVGETIAFVAHHRQPAWDDVRAAKLLEAFELPRHQRIGTLSKGQRTRVSLLLAMAFHPELLLLDEPTGGLDPVMRRQVLENLLAEYMEEGRTVFISSHLINEIAGLVDHVGILKNGRLLRSQPTEELLGGLRRIRLSFANDAPPIACDGLVSLQRQGREAILIVDSFGEATLAQLAIYGATEVTTEPLNLEDAFVALVSDRGGNGHERR